MTHPPLQGPPTNPIVRLLMVISGVIVLAASLFVGAVMFLIILGLAIVMTLIFIVRVWWIRRRLLHAWQAQQRQQGGTPRDAFTGRTPPPGDQRTDRGTTIDGEYQVEREQRRDP